MSYAERRGGRLLRALPGVRSGLFVKDSVCDEGFWGVVEVGAIVSVCDDSTGPGTIKGCAGPEIPKVGPPNENPKSTSLVLRVLC